jgi:hypothetical protein
VVVYRDHCDAIPSIEVYSTDEKCDAGLLSRFSEFEGEISDAFDTAVKTGRTDDALALWSAHQNGVVDKDYLDIEECEVDA